MNALQIEEYLDSVGNIGSLERLKAIASLDLGKRSEAAQRVVNKRYQRLYYKSIGLSDEHARLLTSKDFDKKSEAN